VLDMRRLRYFIAVATSSSFSRAAEELHVAQSAVSRQISLLERDLGVRLLVRTTHDVALTDAGRFLLERGETLARESDRLWTQTREFATGRRGELRIGYSLSAGYQTAPRLIDATRVELPDVTVSAVVLASVLAPVAVIEGRVAVAVARCADDVDDIERIPIRRERLGLVARADDPLVPWRSLDLHDVRERQIVLHERAANPAHFDVVVEACRRAGFEPALVTSGAPFDPTYSTVAAGEAVSIAGESARDALPASLTWIATASPVRVEVSLLVLAGERDALLQRTVDCMLAVAAAERWLSR
jgi:DNA-binding transcriptional LysR family regulator